MTRRTWAELVLFLAGVVLLLLEADPLPGR